MNVNIVIILMAHTRAKIILKNRWFYLGFLIMTIWCKHIRRLEMQKFF